MPFTIHTLISGFTQDYGTWHGIIHLAEKFRRAGHCSGIESRVLYYPWNSNWKHVAQYYFALSEQYDFRPVINIYAYSWGGGYGVPKLCRELRKRQLPVQHVVLSDPVYHSPYLPFRWRAMTIWNYPGLAAPVIRLPDNVLGDVCVFHQQTNRPAGHRVVAENPRAKVHRPVLLTATHQFMDNAVEFHEKALQVAQCL